MSEPEPTDALDASETPAARGSLRGTLVAVLLMAAFFAVTWFGMLALAMERR